MLAAIGWTLLLAVGVILLVKGADVLVEAGGKTAAYLGVSSVVVGLTLVSFGTSLPELGSSVNAVLKNRGGISVGNVIGSNIANVLLVLGISSLIRPISVNEKAIKREIPLMFGAMALLFIFVSSLYSGQNIIKRWEGVLLLVAFASYIIFFGWISLKAKQKKDAEFPPVEVDIEVFERVEDFDWKINLTKIIAGILGIAIGSELMIRAAIFYIDEYHLIEGVVGLTIIAISTSLPELAASSVASYKKHSGISFGNVIGSNTFNILMVLGVTASLTPLAVSPELYSSLFIMLLASLFLTAVVYFRKKITRLEGGLMLAAYFLYLFYITQFG
ncbi:MAG: calcium/sodium antiporter [Candidatus Thermoplasmatota archaeon]